MIAELKYLLKIFSIEQKASDVVI